MAVTGGGEEVDLARLERERSRLLTRECASALAVVGVVAVNQTHRVMEKGEQEHDVRVRALGLSRERETMPTDPLPVRKPVQARGVRGGAGKHSFEDIPWKVIRSA